MNTFFVQNISFKLKVEYNRKTYQMLRKQSKDTKNDLKYEFKSYNETID